MKQDNRRKKIKATFKESLTSKQQEVVETLKILVIQQKMINDILIQMKT